MANNTNTDSRLKLFTKLIPEGRKMVIASNKPLLLNEPDTTWLVFTGKVDIFAVRLEDGRIVGNRTFLFSLDARQAFFGLDVDKVGRSVGLLAVGSGETKVLGVRQARLREVGYQLGLNNVLADVLNEWVEALTDGVIDAIPPTDFKPLQLNQEQALPSQSVTYPPQGVLWVKHLDGESQFSGRTEIPRISRNGFLPVTNQSWLETTDNSKLYATSTPDFLEQDPDWAGLATFHKTILACMAENKTVEEQADYTHWKDEIGANEETMSDALHSFIETLDRVVPQEAAVKEAGGDALLAACQLVGDELGMKFTPLPDSLQDSPEEPVTLMARTAKVRSRQVTLKGKWWKNDFGPMLGYMIEGEGEQEVKKPVALLFEKDKYYVHNPEAENAVAVTPDINNNMHPFAYTFYRTLPMRAISGWDILKFALAGLQREVRLVGVSGLAISLLGQLSPIFIGVLIDSTIPNADIRQLNVLVIALIAAGIGSMMLGITRSFLLLRIGIKMEGAMQSAIWDRLLWLPTSFFRQYSAGDLASRANGISQMGSTLNSQALNTVMNGIFSVTSFIVMFWISWQLALVAVGLAVVLVIAMVIAAYYNLVHIKKTMKAGGRISGLVFELLNGVSKLRVSGSELRAFSLWAKRNAGMSVMGINMRKVTNAYGTFQAVFDDVANIIIFVVVVYLLTKAQQSGQTDGGFSIGMFVAFNASFGQFLSAALGLGQTTVSLMSLKPSYDRSKPILDAIPEADETRSHPGEVAGDIEVNRVFFRYNDEGPDVLNDISLQIKPKEFVAFVGPSGAGKSTLFRLLLGFDQPASGSIYLDGRDLNDIDVQAVRRQIGTVLQHGQVLPGTVLDNIIGSSLLTLDDAWEAAELAGLTEDIQAMPMGMHTVINEGGSTFSGGQRQRLLIARAIVRKPRILLFDEATSALDNRTQALVIRSLEQLQATRIVVAHRLSTIVNADRIYVFDDGEIVQNGTYDELMNKPGPFYDLAKRQLV